jgi:ADP-ribosylglycohydrolase
MDQVPDPVAPQTEAEPRVALFSLVSGEGDGFLLGQAAGDAAGGAWELGYSAVTEQATVIAYQLIEHREIDGQRLLRDIRELDGLEGDEPVYRGETSHFRVWLDRAAAGAPVPEEEPSLDGAPRATPVGVAFRHDAAKVVDEALRLNRPFHADASSLAAGAIAAAAVAAACFGQAGMDLVAGVSEAVLPALPRLAGEASGAERLDHLVSDFERARSLVGSTDGAQILSRLGGEDPDPVHTMLTGLILAAHITDRPHLPLEESARLGGSVLGAAVGAIVGARVGIRAWPWVFANDTWFAEIGRRLVRGPDEVRDLPIPYAVEFHITSGERPGYY